MNLRLIVSLALLIFILILGVALFFLLADFCDTLSDYIAAANAANDALFLSQAEELWLSRAGALSAFIPHDHIDDVTASFRRAASYLADGSEDEFHAETQGILASLEIIRRYDVPTLRSVF